MNYFDRYKERLSADGGNIGESLKKHSKYMQDINFKNTLSYKLAYLDGKINQPIDVNIIDSESDNKKKVKFLTTAKVKTGNYLLFDNIYWLLVSMNTTGLAPTGKVEECNHILKFMNKGKVCEYPAIMSNASKYTLGVEEKEDLKLGNGRFSIQLVDCCDASDLKRGTRLLFNKSAWEITDRDEVTSKGTLILLCTETQIFSEFDDRENEVADRFRAVPLEKPHIDTSQLQGLVGDTNIKIFNTNTFTMYPKDNYEFVIEGNISEDSLVMRQVNENTIKIKNNKLTEGKVTLKIIQNKRMITEKILTFGKGG